VESIIKEFEGFKKKEIFNLKLHNDLQNEVFL